MLHNYSVKIGDFGFSKVLDESCQLLMSSVGTPQYMSPQILAGQKYTMKTDIWSIGMVVFQMLYGKLPWNPNNSNMKIPSKLFDLMSAISLEPLRFPEFPKVTEETKELIRRMLKIPELERISWEELFQLRLKKEYDLKQQLNEIVFEEKQLEFEKARNFARLYFEFNKSIQDAHQILKNQNSNANFFNSHNISVVSYNTQNSHLEEDFGKYREIKRSQPVVHQLETIFLNRRNLAVLLVGFYFKLLDLVAGKEIKETALIQTCMFLFLKEALILLFENYQLLNVQEPTNNPNTNYHIFLETEEGQLVKLLSRYDNTLINLLFNSVLPELTTSLETAPWLA